MSNLPKFRISLKTRIFASVGLMLIPAIVLLLSAIKSIHSSTDSLEHVATTPVQNIVLTGKLKTQLIQTELPFVQYMNRGETSDREVFTRLAVETERTFENIQSSIQLLPHEQSLLSTARNTWNTARSLGNSLLNKGTTVNQDKLIGRQINEFSRHLSHSIAVIDELQNSSRNRIGEIRFAAQEEEWRSISLLLLILSLGVILAIFEAFALGQTVLEPIRRLEHTIKKFREGDLNSRINPKNNDELGHLAEAFNGMAEKFSKIQSDLDYLSIHDTLTGLYESKKFHDEINVEIQRAKRYKRNFSLLLIDIVNFRRVNKTYGRLIGDSVLCSVAIQITNTIRPTDIAARYNADKFAIILSESDEQGGDETKDRIINAITQNPINIGDGKSLPIAVRVGVATYPKDASDETSLFTRAESNIDHTKKPASKLSSIRKFPQQ